jgi:TPR repeat protein
MQKIQYIIVFVLSFVVLYAHATDEISTIQAAAEKGDIVAQFNLGSCYSSGTGVEQSYSEAVKWYRKAAEQGDADAQFNIGICYALGTGVEQSYPESAKWVRKAAELGDAVAQL